LLTQYINHFLVKQFKLNRKDKNKIKFLTQNNDEVAQLAKAFLQLFALKDSYINELTARAVHHERVASELRIAKKIQLNLLPKNAGLLNNPHVSLYAYLEAAHQVGGDFYNFFFIDESRLCFMIGDVSDKGIPAAIFMGVAKSIIETISYYIKSPSEILTAFNKRLCKNNNFSMFTTLFFGILNVDTGELKYVNAGNNPPILLRHEQEPILLETNIQPVSGIFKNLQYTENTLQLDSNDILLMYTDGVTEAKNHEDKLFSEERLLDFMKDIKVVSSRILVRKLITSIKLFTKGEAQSDDIAILALCYNKNIAEKGYSFLSLPAEIASIEPFLNFVLEGISKEQYADERHNEIALVLEETLINIIKHGYPENFDQDDKTISLGYKYNAAEQLLSIRIKDSGQPFNPLTIKKVKPNKLNDLGYGLFLIQDLSDELSYNYQNQQNIFDINFMLNK